MCKVGIKETLRGKLTFFFCVYGKIGTTKKIDPKPNQKHGRIIAITIIMKIIVVYF